MIKVIRNDSFEVEDTDCNIYIKVEHCPTFNVTILGLGSNTDEDDKTVFDSIKELDAYIKLLTRASEELKIMKKSK